MNNLVFLFIKYTKFRGSAYQINCIQSKRLIEVMAFDFILVSTFSSRNGIKYLMPDLFAEDKPKFLHIFHTIF